VNDYIVLGNGFLLASALIENIPGRFAIWQGE
jgi:hypothetical protein